MTYELLTAPSVKFEEVELSRIGIGSPSKAYMIGRSEIEPIDIDLRGFGGVKLKPGDRIVNIEATHNGQRFFFTELEIIDQLVGGEPDSMIARGDVWRCRCHHFKVL